MTQQGNLSYIYTEMYIDNIFSKRIWKVCFKCQERWTYGYITLLVWLKRLLLPIKTISYLNCLYQINLLPQRKCYKFLVDEEGGDTCQNFSKGVDVWNLFLSKWIRVKGHVWYIRKIWKHLFLFFPSTLTWRKVWKNELVREIRWNFFYCSTSWFHKPNQPEKNS